MKNSTDTPLEKLRQSAEYRLRENPVELPPPRSEEEAQRLVHGLEVHKIELEMQNDELRRAQDESELSRNKYAELYDFAPVGYFTFDSRGVIREVNLIGAQLLGTDRRLLAERPFTDFIRDADGREIFFDHLEAVLQRQGLQKCDIQLTGKDGALIHAQLKSITVDTIENNKVYILSSIVDGTQGKQLETAVQDAREYAENIVETVREPLVVLNFDLKILTANHSFYDTFKVTPEDTIGNFIYDLGNRQWDIPKLRILVEEILPHDTVINGYEVEHDFPDIGRKIILLNARQIFRENIGSRIILLAMEDITERKQLESEIQDALKYAENIVETVREPLVVLNSDLKILTANHSFYDTFKVTPDDTVGNFIYDVGNRQWDIPLLRILFEDILPNDTVFNGYEVEHDFPGIGRKTILLNARQIFREDIGSHIILLAMEDITARKQLEKEIQDALKYAESIVETVREPLVVLNSELKILTANHSFYDTFKVTPRETIGNFIYDVGNRQWDIPVLRVLFEDILPNDTVFNSYEVEHDFLEIGRKTILLNARQIFRENIGSHIILLAMEDITERKQLSEELQNAHDKLEVIVGERTRELTKTNMQLTQEIAERRRAEKSLQGTYAEINALKDRLQAENIYLQQEVAQQYNFGEIIGQSEVLSHVFVRVEQVAPMNATVLLLGETGTGKGVVARAIHSSSARKDRPLITVNCATLPASLVESELFGRERGAFTGSDARQVGRFELADGGTIFLDEIGELPLELQSKLLRVIQDGAFERLGSSRTIRTDVRIIAATNRNLEQEIRSGKFREDLYYRLNVFPITLPPLRQRKDDIALLVNHFVAKFNIKIGKKIETVSKEILNNLQEYHWPGNVRELESVIERAVIISQGSSLQVLDQFDTFQKSTDVGVHDFETITALERDLILQALKKTGWRVEGKNGAALLLGIKASTLRYRMGKFGILR